MAYVSVFNTETFDPATSATPDFDAVEFVADDLILCYITQDTGGTTITTATSGWTFIGTQGNAGSSRHAVAYKIATSSSETAPTFDGTNEDWLITTVIVKDADTTTPIDAENSANWSGATTAAPSVTTTTDNCLLLLSAGGDGAGLWKIETPGDALTSITYA